MWSNHSVKAIEFSLIELAWVKVSQPVKSGRVKSVLSDPGQPVQSSQSSPVQSSSTQSS